MNIFRCKHCGNTAILLNDSGVPLVCCGENMEILKPGTTDAALEKHVPSVKINGNKMDVVIGDVVHPMTPEHYIQWIMVEQGNKVQYIKLDHTNEPKATFTVESGPYTVYEYCNLHGLWKKEGNI